MAERKRFQK
uniref:Uncharacterized protein n=1 Tax=Rhizophora mucronata TaxID=61149 RepID=A0A2P2L7U7_RHIMU